MTKWLDWARSLYAIAQTGLHYGKDIYDVERFEQVKAISQAMMADLLDESPQTLVGLMDSDSGHQTPKVDTRAAVWKEDQLLLVQENDGLWSMPGGWMDVTETISSNIKKEVQEEAGCQVQVNRLVAIQDRNRHNPGQNIYTILKVFVDCDYLHGDFQANSETLAAQFFSLDNLPPLMERKTSLQQIQLCAKARRNKDWIVPFD